MEVVKNLFGSYRAENYKEIVNNMLGNFRILGINMSIKVNFLQSHLFPGNLGDESEGQGERSHVDIKKMEERYPGSWDIKLMLDYCWNLKGDVPEAEHSRISQKRSTSLQRERQYVEES